MVSEKLRNMARALARRADEGTLTIEEFAVAIQVMNELADEAAALERAAIPAEIRNTLPIVCEGNVVSLFDRARPQGAVS